MVSSEQIALSVCCHFYAKSNTPIANQFPQKGFLSMKPIVTLLISLILCLANAFGQDYTQWGLPEGAKARLGKGKISSNVAYSCDGTRLAVASFVGIWLYDTATRREVTLLTGHTYSINAIAFSPDGRTVAGGGLDETVYLWDVVTGALTHTLEGHTHWIDSIAFSPDGKILASGGVDNTIRLWDVATGTHIHTLEGDAGDIQSVDFSPDGKTLASGSADGTVRLWDVVTGTSTFARKISRDGAWVNSVVFSPDGRTLASGDSGHVLLWDVVTGMVTHTLEGHAGSVKSVDFSPDGKMLASASTYHTIWLWDVATGTHIRTLEGHAGSVESVDFGPDGKTLASASPSSIFGSDNTVRLWDVTTGVNIHTFTGHTFEISSVAFSPDGRTVASGGRNLHLWDSGTRTHPHTLSGHTDYVASVAFSPDGNTLASGDWGGAVHVWDVLTGTLIRTLEGHTNKVASVAFSPDGSTLASGGWDTTIRLWDVVMGTNIHTLTEHTSSINSVAFSPDGKTLASGGDDDTVRLWEVVTGENTRIFRGSRLWVESVAFSPDGKIIVSGDWGGTIYLWDVVMGVNTHTLKGHLFEINSVAFSPDGRTLASVGADDTVRLWDAVTGVNTHTFRGHRFWSESVAFSPDGRTLASGGDSTVYLWEIVPAAGANATVSVSPTSVPSPTIGERFALFINIADGEGVAGYQATVGFDPSALRYVESTNGDYLPADAVIVPTVVDADRVVLAATSLAGASKGDGILTKLTFEVVTAKTSTLTLFQVTLVDPDGAHSFPLIENGQLLEPPIEPPRVREDLNQDGVVNIQDLVIVAGQFGKSGENRADVNGDGVVNIQDLVLVAGAFGNIAAAPSTHLETLAMLTVDDVEGWLNQARQLTLTDPVYLRGIAVLEQLLVVLTPKETVLLPNYPNPFNPETWIPYHLANAADVTLTVYDTKGVLVRRLDLGYRSVGYYADQSKAAYWDGRNASGESVASGVYFYQLRAGDYTAVRRMVIVK